MVAPKKKAKTKKETENDKPSEEVKPETWTQKASGLLASILAGASAARTASIKLGNMEYASELAEKLLKHASHLEALYQGINKSITKKADEKVMKHHVQEAARLEDFGAKAQAWPARKMFHSSLKWVCFLLRFVNPFYDLPISIKKTFDRSSHWSSPSLPPALGRQPLMLS